MKIFHSLGVYQLLLAYVFATMAFSPRLVFAVEPTPECSGDYFWRVVGADSLPVSSMADVVLAETGEATVIDDLERRKIPLAMDFYVDASVVTSGDGSDPSTAYKDLREAFDAISAISASSTTKATIHLAAGEYRWGDLSNPGFAFNIIGQGPGVSIVNHDETSIDEYAAQVRVADVYIEGITFSGGKNALDLRNMSNATIYNCEIKNASIGNGLSAVNVDQLLVKQVAVHHNFKDGLNYHNPDSPMEVLEYNVEAYQNGQNGEWNSQGSTIHDTVKMVRVNSIFYQNPTNISDVNDSISFNINLDSSNALSNQQDGEYLNYNVGTAAKAYIIGGEYSVGPAPSVVHSHDQSQLFYVSYFNTLSTAAVTGNGAQVDDTLLQELVCDPSPTGPSVCPDEMPLGNLGSGLSTQDLADGKGYLLWSSQNVYDRLYPPPDTASAAEHLIAVKWSGTGWVYDNNQTYSPFEISPDDCLLAEIDFGADTVDLLTEEYGTLYDISYGYLSGDLQVTANQYAGSFNAGEFGLSGTVVYGKDGTPPEPDTSVPADTSDEPIEEPAVEDTDPTPAAPIAEASTSGGGSLSLLWLFFLYFFASSRKPIVIENSVYGFFRSLKFFLSVEGSR